jgi:hypothetical protein
LLFDIVLVSAIFLFRALEEIAAALGMEAVSGKGRVGGRRNEADQLVGGEFEIAV